MLPHPKTLISHRSPEIIRGRGLGLFKILTPSYYSQGICILSIWRCIIVFWRNSQSPNLLNNLLVSGNAVVIYTYVLYVVPWACTLLYSLLFKVAYIFGLSLRKWSRRLSEGFYLFVNFFGSWTWVTNGHVKFKVR